jgi:hypothetical protein
MLVLASTGLFVPFATLVVLAVLTLLLALLAYFFL